MHPKTAVKFDQETFNRVKRDIELLSKTNRGRQNSPSFATEIPEEIGIQLTYRCNLRCETCFQWNDQGFFHHLNKAQLKGELDASIFEKILYETQSAKSNLYLWGGEPLVHHDWSELCRMLEKDPRWTVICTNGLLIEKELDSLLPISSNLVLLVSVDGFQEDNDAIRGKGTFNRVLHNIDIVRSLQKKGEFKGKISISAVLNGELAPRLYDFVEYCESLEIDSLYLVYPWYIPETVANKMDEYFKTNFDWLNTLPEQPKASWHSYTYHVDSEKVELLRQQVEKVNTRTWNIRIRYQPALEADEFSAFVGGSDEPGQRRTRCLSISNRMDVLADGSVSSCKLFPEFNIGNLYEQGVLDIWQSDAFKRVRETIHGSLTPICSKCVLLYRHGL
ncbi:radical SAM protein [Nostoc sp.]|uniref:radical SAM protein n=1 Tax=Nostoc sp. TaxID=1180 RepID=UPI002FF6464A